MNNRFVFDTNSLVSAALIKGSVNAKALDKCFETDTLVISSACLIELIEVIFRPKFDKYLNDERRWSFIGRIEKDSILYTPTETITICRDPKDNKFLELALSANASCIITGDQDLLVLHPFKNIPILSSSDFLIKF